MNVGLVSISFRSLTPQEILRECHAAGVAGVEWGGDKHVPHTAPERGREVLRMTTDHDLSVVCYGSYYRCGVSEDAGLAFNQVLETALALDAPAIRVWVGASGSDSTSPSERQEILDDLRRITELAAAEGIRICAEKHDKTLTDTDAATRDVMETLDHSAFRMLWQPTHGASLEENLVTLDLCRPRLENLHVFHWWPTAKDRQPLVEGEERWKAYLNRARGHADWALLEFFREDKVPQFHRDARTLIAWLEAG